MMGEIAQRLADRVIVTDDNPRSEDPAAIRRQILAAARARREIGDRAARRSAAVAGLDAGDVLVIAGKGHEQRPDRRRATVHPFDDAEVAREAVAAGRPTPDGSGMKPAAVDRRRGGRRDPAGPAPATGAPPASSIDSRTLEPGDLFVALQGPAA